MESSLRWNDRSGGRYTAAISDPSHTRVWVDLRIGESGSATYERAGLGLSIEHNENDQHAILVTARRIDSDETLASLSYRTIPDYSQWTTDEDQRSELADEFRTVQRWSERTVRLAIEVADRVTRAWVDGRHVAEMNTIRGASDGVSLALRDGAELVSSGVFDIDGAERYVQLDPVSWGGEHLGTSDEDGIPFFEGTPLDLQKTGYRFLQAYVFGSALAPDPKRAMLRVPKRQYDRAHLLCHAPQVPDTVSEAAFRFITPVRGRNTTNSFDAPLGGDPRHVTVDLDPGAFHDFLTTDEFDALNLDLTRPVSLDENRFPHPAGPPSSVRISAMTLETAPVALTVTSDTVGHVFEQPETPRFCIGLECQRPEEQSVAITWRVTDPYGSLETGEHTATLSGWERCEEELALSPAVFGTFRLSVTVSQQDGSRPLTRSTTFAVLPPDTRQDELESPFGVWCFFEGHFGVPAETAAPLFRKAGIRWTLTNFLPLNDPARLADVLEVLERHKVRVSCANVACIHITCNEGANVDAMIERMREMPSAPHWLVFWETSLSREHANSFPPELVGDAPRPLTDAESRALDNCVRVAREYAERVREEFPDVKLIFGNGYVPFIGALLQRGFPPDLIDGFGLDYDMYLAMPEWQPGPLHAPFAGLHHLARIQEIYGYADKPRYLTEAIYSPEAEGWLTEREQADSYVRAHLLGMAAGVVHFGMTAEVWDVDGWYHYGHYGPVGLCRTTPELNPRESYCAYATMTRELDGCRFHSMVESPSPSVFILRFEGRDGAVFTCWTVRGRRELTFDSDGSSALSAVDLHGNPAPVITEGSRSTVAISTSPVYLRGTDSLTGVLLGCARHTIREDGVRTLVRFDKKSEWRGVDTPDPHLDDIVNTNRGTVRAPYRHGGVTVTMDGGGLCVATTPDPDTHGLYVRYAVFQYEGDAAIPSDARTIGARILGNSSWGRLVLTITDANGMTWRSLYSHDYIDFDGECLVETRLPGPEDEQDVDPRGYSSWESGDADAVAAPPFRLTGIVVEARTHVVRDSQLDAVADPVWTAREIFTRSEDQK